MPILFLVMACDRSGKAPPQQQVAELAEKVVECENERNDLRDRRVRAQVQLRQEPTAVNPPEAEAPPGASRAEQLSARLGGCDKERKELRDRVPALEKQVATAPPPPPPAAPAAEPPTQARGAAPAPRAVHARARRAPVAGNPEAEGQAAQAVARLFRQNARQFTVCYERGLKRDGNLQFVTKVQVRLTLLPEGQAKGVRLSPRTNPDMEDCVVRTLSTWPMPHYKGAPIDLEIPVSLKTVGG